MIDFSKLKIELYDFLGIFVPGFLLLCDLWIATIGVTPWANEFRAISGSMIFAIGIFSYVLGHLVQEIGDVLVQGLTRERYLKKSRDEFWKSADASAVREALKRDSGFEIASVDTAFDYCLSRAKDSFSKRDAFMATSDLARSLVFLTIPTAICTAVALHKLLISRGIFLGGLLTIAIIAAFCMWVSWRRMVRFRDFADRPVFAAYLAGVKDAQKSAPAAKSASSSAE